MQFSDLQLEVRSRLVEATARAFTDVEIKRFLNLGYRDVVAKTGWPERISGLAAVEDQYEYTLSTDTTHIQHIRWKDQYKIVPATVEQFSAIMGTANTTQSTIPDIYLAMPWNRTIRLYPTPSASSPASAINDAGNLSSSATSVTIDSQTTFPANGIIIIDSEQILYTASTATTLTGLVRGHGGTTAASHLDNATVTVAEILVYNTYMPADLSASGDEPLINEEWHELLVLYAVQIGLQKRQKYKEAAQVLSIYNDQLKEAMMIRTRQTMEGFNCIKDADTLEYGL